jgi:integrase
LAEHFKCNLSAVCTDDLRSYLNAKKCSAIAKNNHRRLIAALFNFAKGAGYLPADESTVADALGTYRVKEKDVTIYTPEELSRLLACADEDFLPWLALIAFGGVRHQELHRELAWESIDFAKGTLIVPAAIFEGGARRAERRRRERLRRQRLAGSGARAIRLPRHRTPLANQWQQPCHLTH